MWLCSVSHPFYTLSPHRSSIMTSGCPIQEVLTVLYPVTTTLLLPVGDFLGTRA